MAGRKGTGPDAQEPSLGVDLGLVLGHCQLLEGAVWWVGCGLGSLCAESMLGKVRHGHLERSRRLRFEASPQPAEDREVSREFHLERGGPTRCSGSNQKVGIQRQIVLPAGMRTQMQNKGRS